MARRGHRQEQSFGSFGWPSGDEPDAALGPDWSDPNSRRAIAKPFGDPVRPTPHAVNQADRTATDRSEAARWPAGEDERARIGYASPDALQARESGVDEAPLVAAAAEITALEALAAEPAKSREEAAIADTAHGDQVAARLREAQMLERMLAQPDAQDPHESR